MDAEKFIALWQNNKLNERAGAQQHFNDLCDLLGVEKPRDPDNYCFERGAKKSDGGDGWADVWKRGHFGWENKKPKRDLDAALKQLTDYALHLENPPLLVVCDRERIIVHTAFTGYPDEPREIRIEQLVEPEARQWLRWVFTDPEKFRPAKSNAAITAEAAAEFAELAKAMRQRGEDGQRVAHFLVQCLFCMFAEDEGLFRAHDSGTGRPQVFTDLLANAGKDPAKAARRIEKLFTAMQKKGGEYGDHDIPWFNGGLFNHIDVPDLAAADLALLHRAASDMDWRAIDPTIFGTLFERGLDPAARAPLGAHYTDTGTIEKLIAPLVREPLMAEWEQARQQIAAELAVPAQKAAAAAKKAAATYQRFLLRLNAFRVLDPACGSGNFLYLALRALRDIEKHVHLDAIELGLPAEISMQTGPHNILGLEINEFAAELARVTVWIGDIQWSNRNGYPHAINPILKPLDGIQHRDALLNEDGSEALWPTADVIVGNPPFLGDKVMRGELGSEYVDKLRHTYDGRVPGGADLVTYWFEKARAQIEAGQLKAAGLVSTNSIRGGANRKVLDRICNSTRIFEAWSDEEWVNDGAAVRVSLVGFGPIFPTDRMAQLDGKCVELIYADLTTSTGLDLTKAQPIAANAACAFIGTQKGGPFDIDGNTARHLLQLPNPNGKPNSEVVRPWCNGSDLVRRPSDTWIIDFGCSTSLDEASLFESPFLHVQTHVLPKREGLKRDNHRIYWWIHAEDRPGMRSALSKCHRYIATPRVAKHRIFVWQPTDVLADSAVSVIARADDTTFGILHSRFHELWSLRLCTWLGVGNDPRYTPTTCFETFPFPAHLTPRDTAGWGPGATISDKHEAPPAPSSPCAPNQQPAPNPQPAQNQQPAQHQSPQQRQADSQQPTPTGSEQPAAITAPPDNPAKAHADAIAAAARRLNALRENWLNPAEWVDWVITQEEAAAGFPKRPVAKPGKEAELKKRTLTNLYNTRPAWLDLAHKELDKAVAAAYGWADYTPETPDDEILRRLLALNLERAGRQSERPARRLKTEHFEKSLTSHGDDANDDQAGA